MNDPFVTAAVDNGTTAMGQPGEAGPAAEWISMGEAARLLGCSLPMVRKLLGRGRLTLRQLEGGRPWILKSDVVAMARESIRPAVRPEPCPA